MKETSNSDSFWIEQVESENDSFSLPRFERGVQSSCDRKHRTYGVQRDYLFIDILASYSNPFIGKKKIE